MFVERRVLIMKKIKKMAKDFVIKHGSKIATVALAFVVISANSSCCIPYYEPQEPKGLSKFKKFND